MNTLAIDLLSAGRCTPNCLLAREANGCECRCGGEFHGALIEVDVPLARQWWAPMRFKPDRRSDDVPVIENAKEFREHKIPWGETQVYVRPQAGGRWAVHAFEVAGGKDGTWDGGQEGFLEGLLLAGRCTSVSPGTRYASAYGFRSWEEAQAAGEALFQMDLRAYEYGVLACLQQLDRHLRPVPHPRLSAALAHVENYERDAAVRRAAQDDPLTGAFMLGAAWRWRYATRRGLPAAS
jgi:hypothetical protein